MDLRTASKKQLDTIENVMYMPNDRKFGQPEFSKVDEGTVSVDLENDVFLWSSDGRRRGCPVERVAAVGV